MSDSQNETLTGSTQINNEGTVEVLDTSLHAGETAMLPSVSIEYPEVDKTEFLGYVDGYIDEYLHDSYLGFPDIDEGRLSQLKTTFNMFVIENIEPHSVMYAQYPEKKQYNPLLSELAGILASLEHNSGVYYDAVDVGKLFHTISKCIVTDDFKTEIASIQSGSSTELSNVIRTHMKSLMSMSNGQSLALVRAADGGWQVLDTSDVSGEGELLPLEVTRQDNDDKGGKYRYRFRKPTYSRIQSAKQQKRAQGGFFTTEWYEEPSYWAEELRSVIREVATHSEESFKENNTHIVLVSEGGIFKGTSTAITDIDTYCFISCDSEDKFEEAYQEVTKSFEDRMDKLQFSTKDEGLRSVFFDSSTHSFYSRNEDGTYSVISYFDRVGDNSVLYSIRNKETGIAVTTSNGMLLCPKANYVDGEKSVDVAVDLNTGEVVALPEEKVQEIKNKKQQNRSVHQDDTGRYYLDIV